MSIQAITFDFWSTLFRDANGKARQKIRIDAFAEASKLPKDTVSSGLMATWAEFERYHQEEGNTLTPLDAVQMTAELLKVEFTSEQERELTEVFATAILMHSPEPVKDALEAVRAAAKVAKLGVISDSGVSPGSSLTQLLERFGFTEYFDVLVFSDEVGVAKPQRPMFEAAANGLDVPPVEILHIGDLEYSDIVGARDFGAHAALFTDVNASFHDTTSAEHIFRTWREFIDALPGFCVG